VLAIDAALADIRSGRTLPVPAHLRDAHYAGAERLGHGKGYQYPHDYPGHFVAQDYLGGRRLFYQPSDQGRERQIKERLDRWREIMAQAKTRDES
jgi:putative ATPase